MARKYVSSAVTADFLGQLPVFRSTPEPENGGDFRQVPASDRGNASYSDRGQFGSYAPSREAYAPPSDVRFEAGFGADVDDLRRGYCVPTIRESPAYDLDNYQNRATLPRYPDEDGQETLGESAMEFRARGERSRGFLTRPKIPVER